MNDFNIAWLFPNTLFLHGDRGNVLALKRFSKLMGLNPVVQKIDFDTKEFEPAKFDIIFAGPGEISSFPELKKWFDCRSSAISEFVSNGRPLLVTGTSICLFGDEYVRTDGTVYSGLGIISTNFTENNNVYGDDIWYECNYNEKNLQIIGNQIQMGNLEIIDEKPLGKVIYGYGNNGKDKNEGLIKENSIFTNTLGPILTCNPWLTIEMIKVACKYRGIEISSDIYDNTLEKASFEAKKMFINDKEKCL